MIDLSLIVDIDEPVSNFVKLTRWRMRWRNRFGIFPNSNFHTVRPCEICGKPAWIIPLDFVNNGAFCVEHLGVKHAKNNTK